MMLGADAEQSSRALTLTGLLVLLAMLLPVAVGADEAPSPSAAGSSGAQRANLMGAAPLRGKLSGDSPPTLRFLEEATGRAVSLTEVRQIGLDSAPLWQGRPGVWRKVIFWGGESLTGELRGCDDQELQLRTSWGETVKIPRGEISGLHHPEGEVTLAWDDFEAEETVWKSPGQSAVPRNGTQARSGRRSLPLTTLPQTYEYRLPEPIRRGQVALAFYDSARITPGQQWLIEWSFDTPDGPQRLRAVLGADQPTYRLETPDSPAEAHSPLTVQPLKRTAGWHHLALLVDDTRLLVAIDQDLLATGRPPAGKLTTVRILQRSPPPQDSPPKAPPILAWIDDFQVQQRLIESPAPLWRTQRRQDQVLLRTGDEVFGRVQTIGTRDVTLHGAFGEWQAPWTELCGIWFARKEAEAPSPPLRGWIARVEWQPPIGRAAESPDWLMVALQRVEGEQLIVDHPALGRMRIPLAQLRKIEPLFAGVRHALEPDVQHLGDEIRRDFRFPLPDGPRLERTLTLTTVPAGPAFVSLLVDNLEPSGPQTLAGNPFLTELRAGSLGTELFINGQRVDNLNRHLHLRIPADRPERLRIPIPAGWLKSGKNTFRLEQLPSRDDPLDFDDAGVSHFAVELAE